MRIPPLVSGLLRSSAPTLLTALALPPPVNAIAASVVSHALERLPGAKPAATVSSGAATRAAMSPQQVVEMIKENAGDPEIFVALQQAETALQQYELEAGVRFAELELEDRKRASDFQTANQLGDLAFRHGMRLVWIAMGGMLVVVVLLLLVATGVLDLTDSSFATAAFGLIGTAVGFINGIAGAVVTFYWGSSQGSKEKSAAMDRSIQKFSEDLGRAAKANAAATPPPAPAGATAPAPSLAPAAPPVLAAEAPVNAELRVSEPTVPAGSELLGEMLPHLCVPHRHFDDAVSWALADGGIRIDGGPPERTPGDPKTIRRIWQEYGDLCARWSKHFQVPVELIIATIATESSGNRSARRAEPQIRDESVGLMQTLVTTARETLGRASLTGDDLLEPSLSIEAGTSYIARQRKSTHFDPPLVAAAYNAGSLRRENAAQNRWLLICYPSKTGEHIDRFVSWFGDAMAVSRDDRWGATTGAPSFAAAVAGMPDGGAAAMIAAAAAPAIPDPAAMLMRPAPLLESFQDSLGYDILVDQTGLVTEIQQRLSAFGYLDPPADGDFGPITKWSMKVFCKTRGLAEQDIFDRDTASALTIPTNGLPDIPRHQTLSWVNRVADYMTAKGFWICRVPECRNIVYLEGANMDGTLNDDRIDVFNDLRLLFWIDGQTGQLQTRAWQATTEPGKFFTDRPLNPLGAARIKFGQYAAWSVGKHHPGKPGEHEALRQTADVSVYRDLNKDHERQGDRVETGIFFINQHWGYDRPEDNIGRTSAGCLVGRTKKGHEEFMTEVKRDPRYKANNGYRFLTTILPAKEVLG